VRLASCSPSFRLKASTSSMSTSAAISKHKASEYSCEFPPLTTLADVVEWSRDKRFREITHVRIKRALDAVALKQTPEPDRMDPVYSFCGSFSSTPGK